MAGRRRPRIDGDVIVYLLRHADAEESNPDGDGARRLTERGRHALQAAAPLWQRLKLQPDVVLTSPLVRAVETAELLSEGITAPAPITDDRLRPGATWDAVAAAIAERPGVRRVMVIGHEPDLSDIAAELTGASAVRMRKGGLACIEFERDPRPGTGEIVWLIDPDLYGDGHG
jgi:phosphohistidine phosphatase